MFDYIIITIAIVWLIAASISDIKTKEVPNWLNFSLIAIAFSIIVLRSIYEKDLKYLSNGLIGFGIFFLIGNLMYYGKQWGGGDSKLLYGLGILFYEYPPMLKNYFTPNLNLPFLMILFLNILIIGSIYGVSISLILIIKKRKDFSQRFKEYYLKTKKITKFFIVLFLISFIASLIFIKQTNLQILIIISSLIPFFIFYLFLAIKSIEEVCMYKKIKTNKLTEGDWVAEIIKIDKKTIYNPKKSLGVTKQQIELIKKHKKEVLIKDGIAFVPPFLIATIISLLFGNFLF